MSALDPGRRTTIQGDVGSAVVDVIEDLLQDPSNAPAVAARTLDGLRRRLHATEAVVWLARDAAVSRALHVGTVTQPVNPVLVSEGCPVALERLRGNATILCGSGEISGIETLVPDGVRSFAAAASRRLGEVTCVLVIGWADPVPPCDEADVVHLRTAAAMLERALSTEMHANDQSYLEDAILGSLSGHIAVIDREGTIITVNAAWTDFGRREGITTAIGPGVNYLEACRRAAANGSYDAAVALQGIQAVCTGASNEFQTAYSTNARASDERWWLMTVTPLRRPEGGAVIVHTDVTRQKVTELASRVGDALFHRLADTVPVPIWIVSPDGFLMYGNQAWVEATAPPAGGVADAAVWMEAGHPDDRVRATSDFRAAVRHHGRFETELRLRRADGSYRWWSVVGVPRLAADGTVESYVGMCVDVTATRHAQHALHELASKLVTAQESERSRIARELHDDLGQQVALLGSKLELVAHSRQPSRNRMHATLAEARKSLQQLATSIHNLSHELHPAKIKLLGLAPALETFCRNVSVQSGLAISFDGHSIPPDVTEDSALCIFRVTQEALQNAVKHSASRSIEVKVTGSPDELTLQVIDDGAGFDPLASQSAGLGLLTMRERVELVGGRLRIETSHGRGTMIEATIPMVQRGAQAT
jgi:PAS domain S-box-containing protein